MSRRLRVYIAGPLSTGERTWNVRRAVDVAIRLVEAGYAPLCPHLTHYLDPTDRLGYGTWLDVDEAWVAVAEAVWRIPGVSPGADREVALAERLGIPVVDSLSALRQLTPREERV